MSESNKRNTSNKNNKKEPGRTIVISDYFGCPKKNHKMKEFKEIYNAILQINLKNIENNYDYLKRNAPNTIIAACVKANSYGLGSN